MKLSIIVPVHNSQNYLEECVLSLINQTYPDKEIILIDNGSTDDSASICDDFSQRYPFVTTIHQENRNVYGARNRGLENATGDYIALVDSDDALDSDAFQIMIDELNKTESDAAICGYETNYGEHLNIKKKNLNNYRKYVVDGKVNCQKSIYNGDGFSLTGFVWNKVFKKEIVAGLRFNDQLEIIDDLFFVIQSISNTNRICYVDLPMYHYRYVEGGATQKPNIPRLIKCLESYKWVIGWAEDNAPACVDDIHRDFIFWNTKTAEMMLRSYDDNAYLTIRHNLNKEKEYIRYCKLRIKVLANLLLQSWTLYKIFGSAVWHAKRVYRKIKKD